MNESKRINSSAPKNPKQRTNQRTRPMSTTYETAHSALKDIMCSDTAGIVMSFLDYRIPEEEVRKQKCQVMDEMLWCSFPDEDRYY